MDIPLIAPLLGRRRPIARRVTGAASGPDRPAAIRRPQGITQEITLEDTLDDLVGGPLTTPFEDWCESAGTHPEAPGAWESFTRGAAAS